MKRNVWSNLLLAMICTWALPACAATLTYSAKEIHGQIVDAETGKAVEGAVIVAQWVLSHIGSGGYGARLHVYETVTDKGGNYTIPAWGPVPRPPLTDLIFRDPQILIFKSSYEPEGLENRVPQTESVRISEWDGKIVKLARTKRNVDEQVSRLSSFYDGVVRDARNPNEWKEYPRIALAVYQEYERLKAQGAKPGHRPSLPFLEKLDDADRRYFLKESER